MHINTISHVKCGWLIQTHSVPTRVKTSLTVLVAWLSEGFSLREDDSHRQVLERGDVEKGGVLVVFDVFLIFGDCNIQIVGEIGSGNVTGAAGEEGTERWLQTVYTEICIHYYLCFFKYIETAHRDKSGHFSLYVFKQIQDQTGNAGCCNPRRLQLHVHWFAGESLL